MKKHLKYFAVLMRDKSSLLPDSYKHYKENKDYIGLHAKLVPGSDITYQEQMADTLLFLLAVSTNPFFKYKDFRSFIVPDAPLAAQFELSSASGKCSYRPEEHTEPIMHFSTKVSMESNNQYKVTRDSDITFYDDVSEIPLGCGCYFLPKDMSVGDSVSINISLPYRVPNIREVLKDISPRYLRLAEVDPLDTPVESIAKLVVQLIKESIRE